MPYITYDWDYKPRPDTERIIRWADSVARDYKTRGLDLTLRQLYYQGVSQNMFPNSERSYKNLGNAVSKGRMAGLIDWSLLEDRTRTPGGVGWFERQLPSIDSLIRNARWGRTHDLWEGQENRVEVWVEKQALEQVASRAAGKYRVPYIACKGYMSQSEMWEAGYNRLRQYISSGYNPVILHIGDHDPSGIDMSRDIQERLSLFAEGHVKLRRLALNMDQIDEFNPPPNPAKITDSRFRGYEEKFGSKSWELDALKPEMLIELIENAIVEEVDVELYNQRISEEDDAMQEMLDKADRWPEFEQWLEENPEES